MSIILTDHDHKWKITVSNEITKCSNYLKEVIMCDEEVCDDIEVIILEGDTSTSKMTEEAITKLQLLQKLSICINEFNHLEKGIIYETLLAHIIEIKKTLESDKIPQPHPKCKYCSYRREAGQKINARLL